MRSAPLALTVAGALALAGCGGGGSGSASTATNTAARTSAAITKSSAQPKSKSTQAKGGGKSHGAESASPGGSTTKGRAAKTTPAQEDAMIVRTYGTAGSSAERDQAAQVAALFLSARAAGNWTQACANLAAKLRAQLEPYAQTTTGSAEQRCAEALRTVSAKAPKTTPAGADVHALTLRVKGEEALLIYRDGTGKTLDIPMLRDGGEWKVGAVAAGPLA
jgi:hypothetical protein